MGIDLRLLPFESDFYSHSILSMDRDHELFDIILECEKISASFVPASFHTFLSREDGNSTYGNTQHTPYGDRLKYVTARHFNIILGKYYHNSSGYMSKVNYAVFSYIAHLEGDTKIALYWH